MEGIRVNSDECRGVPGEARGKRGGFRKGINKISAGAGGSERF